MPWRPAPARGTRLCAGALLALLAAALLFAGLRATGGSPPTRTGADATARSLTLSGLPLAARGPISAALARHDGAYRVHRKGAGLRASNPAQLFSARFSSRAVVLAAGGARVGLGRPEIGRGSRLRSLAAAAPRASANRVLYRRGAAGEWYLNTPAGLEQGFSIASPPRGHGGLTVALPILGNAEASLAGGAAASVLFTYRGKPVLRYGGLQASDARGRALRSRLALAGGHILLRIDLHGARFPVRIDPWFEQAELTAGYGVGGSLFGYSVALSADGNTALVGGPRNRNHLGAAWVFARSGETWTQQSPVLVGSEEVVKEGGGEEGEEGVEEGFGTSVALSADGSIALIGAPREGGKAGAAWAFTRSGSTWNPSGQRLTGFGEIGPGRLGRSVALSADGATALIGGSADSTGHGAVWAFVRSGQSYSQQAKLTTAGSVGEARFGRSLALSADGATALIGAPGDQHSAGAAWVFARSNGAWSQQGEKLTGGGEVGEARFGRSVALSANGASALIGGYDDNERAGAVWAFAREGQSWTQQGSKLTAGGEVGEGLFGFSVALSADGNSALIGGYGQESHAGGAWAFARSGSSWSQQGAPIAAPAAGRNGWFGFSVALAGDGATALIGEPTESSKAGSVRVLVTSAPGGPMNSALPEISGSVHSGGGLSCSAGTWNGSPTFSYQWLRDGSPIAGAEAPMYTVQSADEGHTLTCVVTATDAIGRTAKAESTGVSIPGGSHPAQSQTSGPLTAKTASTGGGGVLGFKGTAAGLPAPVFGKTANLLLSSGTVLVKLPGRSSFVRLTAGMNVPLGTIVDATLGRVELISAADVASKTDQTGIFYGGIFEISQVSAASALKGGKTVVITVLTLVGPPPSGCKARRAKHASVAAKHRSRRLWGNAHGNFTSSGRYASATVKGTQWLTEDTCAGTLVRVVSGVVSVNDLPHHHSFLLKAPKHFLAHPGHGG